MSRGMLSRITGWRPRKKSYQGRGGFDEPQISKHVREQRPPKISASQLDGRERAETRDDSFLSAAIALKDEYEPPSTVVRGMHKVMANPESPARDSQLNQIHSRPEALPPNIKSPARFQSSSTSGPSPVDDMDRERTLLANRDGLALHSRESEKTPSPMHSQHPPRSDFPAPLETPPPEIGHGTTRRLHRRDNDPKPVNSLQLIPASSPASIPNTFQESISHDSANGHMTEQSDLTADAQSSEPLSDEILHLESNVERRGGLTHLEGTADNPRSSLDYQDEPASVEVLSHQKSNFGATERQDSFVITQVRPDRATDEPEGPEPKSPEPIWKGEHHTGQLFDARERQGSSSSIRDLTELISNESSHQDATSEEQYHPSTVLEEENHLGPVLEENHPGPLSKELDALENYPKEPSVPSAMSEGQSRADSIQSQEVARGRDQRPEAHREARLQRLRWRSLKTRALVCEKRTELHQSREEMSDADAEFVNLSRQRWINGGLHDDLTLKASFEKLQAARDAYGPLEEAYNTLEERLDREEYELAELEEKVLSDGGSILEGQDATSLESRSKSSDEGDSQILEATAEQQNPLYKEYMSKLGDLVILREAYSSLLAEHDSLLEALEVSQRYGRELPLEDQTTLLKFNAEEQKMSSELRQIDADVERLRVECIQQGLWPGVDSDESDILQAADGLVDAEQAEYNRFPRLLSQPGVAEDEEHSRELLTQFRSGDTGDRITRWLLHKLRSSCSEVELLARFKDELDLNINTQKWQEEVLYFWFTDSANLPPSAYELEPTLTAATTSSPATDLDQAPPLKRFGEKQFIQLVVRSSSLSRSLEFGLLLKLARMKGRSAVTNYQSG